MNDIETDKGFGGQGSFSSVPEPPPSNPETGDETKHSFLGTIISSDGLFTEEAHLEGEDKEQHLIKTTDGRNNESLVFDTESLNISEKDVITQFLSAVQDKGKNGLKGTSFEWFFEEESEEFITNLQTKLKTRLQELDSQDQFSGFRNLQVDKDPLIQAVQSFREMAKRREIRSALEQQIDELPVLGFQAKKKDGTIVNFTKDDLKNKKSGLEYFYAKGKNGKSELIITFTKTDEYEMGWPVYPDPEDENSQKQFTRIAGTGDQISKSGDQFTGRDTSSFEFDIVRGNAQHDPIFSKVRVMFRPMDLDKELDDYLEQQHEEAKKQIKQTPSTQTYSPQAPSVPSTPRYSYPTTYVRSG